MTRHHQRPAMDGHATAGPSGEPAEHAPPTRVLREDLPASFVIFLVAIPLSLGIAATCGAPLMAGLIAAVVGGVVAGALGGVPLQVSGPAAGLAVIVGHLIAQYGWPATAAITAAAGIVQILLGVTRVGRVALSLSPAVVHGMLAGIGMVIAVGQLHVVLGGDADRSVLANLRGLPAQISAHPPHSVLVGVLTIVVMLLWPVIPRASVVPGPLVGVVAGTTLASLLSLDVARVHLPHNPLDAVVLPNLPNGNLGDIAVAVLTVAMVASVESLLSAVAVDKLHNGPRANLDRELIGQGAANLISGALGGLPVTGAIVRGSTNVAAGARTRASAILHGLWVAVFVIALGSVLELVPLAALAAVLLVMGVRLISVDHMRRLRKHREFGVYTATVVGVVLLGLVEGVLVGVAVAVIRALYRLAHTSIRVEDEGQGNWRVVVRGSLVFLGVGRLVRELRTIPMGDRVVLELHIDFLDHAAFEAIHDWRDAYERLGGTAVVDEVHDTWYHLATSGRPERRKTTSPVPPCWFAPWAHWQSLHAGQRTVGVGDPLIPEPRGGLDPMLLGVNEFERRSAPLVRPFLAELAAKGQRPTQLFITCADSRILPNLITTSGPGDLFCVRNIGNLVPPHLDAANTKDSSVGAAIEFAVDVLGVSTVAVCGHSDCGAMKAVINGSARNGSHLHDWLRYAEPSLIRFPEFGTPSPTDLRVLERFCVANVVQQLANLMTYPSVRAATTAGRLNLVGMYFDISAVRVYLVDRHRGQLEAVVDQTATFDEAQR